MISRRKMLTGAATIVAVPAVVVDHPRNVVERMPAMLEHVSIGIEIDTAVMNHPQGLRVIEWTMMDVIGIRDAVEV